MRKLKTAIIDIGSNTIRLVLYKYNKNDGLQEFGNMKTVARLRNYILPNGEMSEEGIQLLADTLNSFKKIIDDFEVTDILAVATAAVRQAKNGKKIISRMKKETGIPIQLLSEEEEAYYGFLAIAHSMDTPSAVTIDIGGGSTEITLYKNKKLQKTHSFPFGTVSLKQKFVSKELMDETEKKSLRLYIKKQLENIPWIHNLKLPVIAIGGSARNIAQIHQHRIDYPISGVHHYELKFEELLELRKFLGTMTIDQLKQLDGMSSDRADIIEIALEVFLMLVEEVNSKSFQVSKKGLREGLIISRVLQNNPQAFDKNNVFKEHSTRIANKYGRTEEEAKTLVSLSEQLYQECCRLQLFEYNDSHLDLIKKAAKLYLIGEYIEQDSASQHTFYLLANQSIDGMKHSERVKLALLASYKNRDYYRRFATQFEFLIPCEELKEIRDYGALLKFIYSLNFSKRNNVKKIKIDKQDSNLIIYIYTKSAVMAELYRAEKQKKHLERLFKIPVITKFIEEG